MDFGDGSVLVEGDIVLTAEQYRELNHSDTRRYRRKAVRDTRFRWPNAIIPYHYHYSLGEFPYV